MNTTLLDNTKRMADDDGKKGNDNDKNALTLQVASVDFATALKETAENLQMAASRLRDDWHNVSEELQAQGYETARV